LNYSYFLLDIIEIHATIELEETKHNLQFRFIFRKDTGYWKEENDTEITARTEDASGCKPFLQGHRKARKMKSMGMK
jgi:hypothetical protein